MTHDPVSEAFGWNNLDNWGIAAGTVDGRHVALFGVLGDKGTDLFCVEPVSWPEAMQLLARIDAAPDPVSKPNELVGMLLAHFLDDINAWQEPWLPAEGFYRAYVEWTAKTPGTPGPYSESEFGAFMARNGYRKETKLGVAVYVQSETQFFQPAEKAAA